jgi:hypothetical protein
MKCQNEVLARELELTLEAWNYHWHVEGPTGEARQDGVHAGRHREVSASAEKQCWKQ